MSDTRTLRLLIELPGFYADDCELCCARSKVGSNESHFRVRAMSDAVEGREGMLTVYRFDGGYAGCIGSETWERLLRCEGHELGCCVRVDMDCTCGATGEHPPCPECGKQPNVSFAPGQHKDFPAESGRVFVCSRRGWITYPEVVAGDE